MYDQLPQIQIHRSKIELNVYFCIFVDFKLNLCTMKTLDNRMVKKYTSSIFLSLLLLFTLTSITAKGSYSLRQIDSSGVQIKVIKNTQVQVKIKLELNELSFEITRGNANYKVTAVNEIGKISFTNAKSILSYLGNVFNRVDYVLYKAEYLLFPMQDAYGKLIFYRVALDLDNGTSTSSLPYLMMKGQTALFNQKTSKMLVYEQIKQENTKTKKLFYVTNFNIYHLDKSEKENYREFYSTEKFVGVPSNLSPQVLKIRMMDLLIDFMPNYTIENYFR